MDAKPGLPPEALRYLEHARVEKRLAARTLTLYTLDLEKLMQFAAGVNLPLLQLTSAHIRRFVAQMHSSGRGGRARRRGGRRPGAPGDRRPASTSVVVTESR